MSQLDALKALLDSAGYSYEVSGYESDYTVSIKVPIEYVELPEGLRPFAWSPDQVERAMWKGNATKQTFIGAEFELALRDYANHIMFTDPESVELDKTLEDVTNLEELTTYKAKRDVIWTRICRRPEIIEWEAALDKLL